MSRCILCTHRRDVLIVMRYFCFGKFKSIFVFFLCMCLLSLLFLCFLVVTLESEFSLENRYFDVFFICILCLLCYHSEIINQFRMKSIFRYLVYYRSFYNGIDFTLRHLMNKTKGSLTSALICAF